MTVETQKNVHLVADWIFEKLKTSYELAVSSNRSMPLIFPACSVELGVQVQIRLIESGFNAVLVSNTLDDWSKAAREKLIATTPDRTTTYRKVTAIFVIMPGSLQEML